MSCPAVALALAAILATASSTASADPAQVAEATALVQQGQLTAALTAFERALASGGNDVADLRVIYRQLGVLRAGVGDAEGAQEAFERLLEVEPHATLPADTSPVVLEPFERARVAAPRAPEAPAPAPVTRTRARLVVTPTSLEEEPRPPRHGAVLSSPWFWGGAVAAAVGVVLVIVLVSSSGGDSIYVDNGGFERR